MFCINCGKEIMEEVTFCPLCGYKQYCENINEDEWYYIINNVRRGPCNVNEIISEVTQGNITRDSLVWKKGMQNWIPAGQTSISNILQSTVPTMPKDKVDNRFVWALATIPILASWIITGFLGASQVITIITIGLNIAFLSLDVKALKKSGINAESWLWLGMVLIPLYLFMRASKTDKKYAYGITWCAMFLLNLII